MTAPAASPRIIIVSGPSGSGKSTLVERLRALPGTMFCGVLHDASPAGDGKPRKML